MAVVIDVKAGRIYFKPLLPSDPLKGLDPEDALKRIRKDLLRRIKKNLLQEVFSDRAKRALAKAIKIRVDPSSLLITVNHPAYRPLVEGQKQGQMKWLTKAVRPIPIITETGELIFRSATPKSMRDGKWVHPGRGTSNFMERAKEGAKDHARTVLAKEIKKQIQMSLGRKK
jgi:hypothetical protein